MDVQRRGESAHPIGANSALARVDRRLLLSAALPAALAACSSTQLDSFDLASVPATAPRQAKRAVIFIEEPTAPAILASNRIAIRRPGGDYAYLSGAQWSDQLTQLVQRRLVHSFENARLFQAVADTGTASDFILSTDLRRFEVDGETNQAVVEATVRLVAARTGKTVQGTTVSGSAPAPTKGAVAITASLDEAFGQATEKILSFAVSRT